MAIAHSLQISRTSAATAQQGFGWIVSPLWDTLFFLAPPLLALIPAWTADLSRFESTHLLLLLAVIAAGHHVPGILRAYSDLELLQRYRLRMWWAPGLLFAAAAYCELQGIAGLQFVVLIWGVWHVLMQTYGLMRIYGAKRGETSRRTATLDWLIMLAWISATYLNHPAWSYRLRYQLYDFGIPFLPRLALTYLGYGILAAAVLITLWYLVHAVQERRRGAASSGLKHVLLLSNLLFFLLAFSFTNSILLVTVMVELVHDLQYYCLTWAFQLRLAQRASGVRAWVQLLFRPTPAMVLVYLIICLSYGAVFSDYGRAYVFEGSVLAGWTRATLLAATLFHFYSDGFIWKVRQERTREYLGIEAQAAAEKEQVAASRKRSWLHLAAFAAGMGLLLTAHAWRPQRSLAIAQQLVVELPHLGDAHHTLGWEYAQRAQWEAALNEYAAALRFGVQEEIPVRQRYASALQAHGQEAEAVAMLQAAIARAPEYQVPGLAAQLAMVFAEAHEPSVRQPERAVQLAEMACSGESPRAAFWDVLAACYAATGRLPEAIQAAQRACLVARDEGEAELLRRSRKRLRELQATLHSSSEEGTRQGVSSPSTKIQPLSAGKS